MDGIIKYFNPLLNPVILAEAVVPPSAGRLASGGIQRNKGNHLDTPATHQQQDGFSLPVTRLHLSVEFTLYFQTRPRAQQHGLQPPVSPAQPSLQSPPPLTYPQPLESYPPEK